MREPPRVPIFDIIPPGPQKRPLSVSEEIGKKLTPSEEEPEENIPIAEESQQGREDLFLHKLASEKKSPPPSWDLTGKPKIIQRFAFLILGILIFGISIAFGSASVSRAKITLITDRAFSPFSFEVTLDTKVQSPDFAARRLPLQLLKKSISLKRDFQATGEGTLKAFARGRVTLYNQYSNVSQILVANTRLQSPDGKIFRLTSRVVIPANGSTTAEVVAANAGPEYNIGPTRFTIPAFKEQGLTERYQKIYAESKEAFRGGAAGKTKIVTEEDLRGSQQSLSQEVLETLRREIRQALQEGFVLLEQGATRFSVNSISANVKAGDAASSFTISIDAGMEALAFNESYIEALARRELESDKLLQDLPNAKFEFAYVPLREADFTNGTLTLKVDASVNVAKSIDVSQIKQSLAGKREIEIERELITIPGIREVRVTLWPRWVRTIPRELNRIEVAVE